MVAAVYGRLRASCTGGDVDQAYENADRAMQPLGLSITERPEIRFETREPAMSGYSARLRGPLVMAGKRHGRAVSVNQEDGASEVRVGGTVPAFEAKTRMGGSGHSTERRRRWAPSSAGSPTRPAGRASPSAAAPRHRHQPQGRSHLPALRSLARRAPRPGTLTLALTTLRRGKG